MADVQAAPDSKRKREALRVLCMSGSFGIT